MHSFGTSLEGLSNAAKALGKVDVLAKIRTLVKISPEAPIDHPTLNSIIEAKYFKLHFIMGKQPAFCRIETTF
jgi:hypothetical protein